MPALNVDLWDSKHRKPWKVKHEWVLILGESKSRPKNSYTLQMNYITNPVPWPTRTRKLESRFISFIIWSMSWVTTSCRTVFEPWDITKLIHDENRPPNLYKQTSPEQHLGYIWGYMTLSLQKTNPRPYNMNRTTRWQGSFTHSNSIVLQFLFLLPDFEASRRCPACF